MRLQHTCSLVVSVGYHLYHEPVVISIAIDGHDDCERRILGKGSVLRAIRSRRPVSKTYSLTRTAKSRSGPVPTPHMTELWFQFAAGLEDGTIQLWDMRKNHKPVHLLTAHQAPSTTSYIRDNRNLK